MAGEIEKLGNCYALFIIFLLFIEQVLFSRATMSAQNWKDEVRNANKTTFKGLNSDWSNFGLKSKKAEAPKLKLFQRADCSEILILLRNLQSDIEGMFILMYMKR